MIQDSGNNHVRTPSCVTTENSPASLIVNLDQAPLSYVSPRKHTFSFRGAKNVTFKGKKRQETDHLDFRCSFRWEILADSTNLPEKISTLPAKIQLSGLSLH